MLNFLLLCFAHCQSLWVKNLGNIKGHLDREASVVGNSHLFQSCAVGQKNLEISILGFTEEREPRESEWNTTGWATTLKIILKD